MSINILLDLSTWGVISLTMHHSSELINWCNRLPRANLYYSCYVAVINTYPLKNKRLNVSYIIIVNKWNGPNQNYSYLFSLVIRYYCRQTLWKATNNWRKHIMARIHFASESLWMFRYTNQELSLNTLWRNFSVNSVFSTVVISTEITRYARGSKKSLI